MNNQNSTLSHAELGRNAATSELTTIELDAVCGGGKIMERYDQSAKNVIQSMRG